ncbi:MAG TPA: alpha/beta fold hydrolase [Deltaproteobacteria bacterium]|jgi:polyhydroxyalkanoate synthase|nr:alpha/beta fold hydrolase [Deltaproteobacteria bacterium]HOI06883.1 alpha/beta fold hydrolase [Deltaproteobacteria bacterium]
MNIYKQLDKARRWQGEIMDAAGLGPEETPSRTVLSAPAVTLKAYGEAGPGPVLLLVPAPIKRAYIWDLAPELSVVRAGLRHSLQVYLVQWERPGPAEDGLGLDAYACSFLLGCLDAIAAETGRRRVFLAGHSLGGTFSAIFTSLLPERVRGLMMVGAPVNFGPGIGALDTLVAGGPRAETITEGLGNVPGTFLNTVSALASPRSFQQERAWDWLISLADFESFRTHLMVERWSLDESPLPKALFEDVVDGLYRRNLFMRGELTVAGKRALPEAIDVPLVSVVDERSDVVSPRSSLLLHDAVKSTDLQVLRYEGDVGVAFQHVGMLVGRNAHRTLWPKLMRWALARSAGN